MQSYLSVVHTKKKIDYFINSPTYTTQITKKNNQKIMRIYLFALVNLFLCAALYTTCSADYSARDVIVKDRRLYVDG